MLCSGCNSILFQHFESSELSWVIFFFGRFCWFDQPLVLEFSLFECDTQSDAPSLFVFFNGQIQCHFCDFSSVLCRLTLLLFQLILPAEPSGELFLKYTMMCLMESQTLSWMAVCVEHYKVSHLLLKWLFREWICDITNSLELWFTSWCFIQHRQEVKN